MFLNGDKDNAGIRASDSLLGASKLVKLTYSQRISSCKGQTPLPERGVYLGASRGLIETAGNWTQAHPVYSLSIRILNFFAGPQYSQIFLILSLDLFLNYS